MKRKLTVAFVLFAVYLVVSAAPVAAASTATSIHTTDSDFNSQSRDDLQLEGSGTSAHLSVTKTRGEGAISRWKMNEGSGDTAGDAYGSNDGTLKGATHPEWVSSKSGMGEALSFDTDHGDYVDVPDSNSLDVTGDSITFGAWVNGDNFSKAENNQNFLLSKYDYGEFGYGMLISPGNDTHGYVRIDLNTDEPDGAPSNQRWSTDVMVKEGEWTPIYARYNGTHLSVWKNGEQKAVREWSGSINSSSGMDLTMGGPSNQPDSDKFGLTGSLDEPRIFGAALPDSQMETLASAPEDVADHEGSYTGTHTVEDADTGFTDLTLDNVAATVEWRGYDGSSWETITTDTYTTSGNKSVDLETGTPDYEQYRVVVDMEIDDGAGSDYVGELHAEGVTYPTYAPEVDDSSAEPTGKVDQKQVTLQIDATDRDFGLSHGDTATAEFYVNGSKVGTDTLTSNGTASLDYTATEGGERDWYVKVTDDYGHSDTSSTFTFQAPSELSIYNESDPDSLVSGPNTTVTLRFYFDDGSGMVVERSTNDGTINMTGLPVDQSFVVVADADGYYPRRIFVESLFQTQNVYLLPDSATAVEPIFTLQDYTGTYDSETTVLQVQRSLDGSWQTVTGDFFGASGEYPAQIERNVRHRLVLIDTTTGERKILGTYTPLTSERQTLKVKSSGEIELISPAVVDISPATGSLPALDGTTISTALNARGQTVDSWSAEVTYHEGGNVTTLATASKSSSGTADLSVDLAERVNGTVKVSVEYTIDGTTASETFTYEVTKTYQNKYSLFNTVGRIDTLVPEGNREGFKAFVSLIATVVLTTGAVHQLRASTEMAGLTAVGCIAGFAIIGWMSYDVLFASVVAFGAFTAVRRGL